MPPASTYTSTSTQHPANDTAVTIAETRGHDTEMTSPTRFIGVGHDGRNGRSRSPKYAVLRSARLEAVTSEDSARSCVVLLAVLHKRFGELLERIARELPVISHGDFLRSLVTELRFLDEHASEPLQALLARIVRQRVLDRHLWVAIQKFRGPGDYTFLLESDDGRVRLRQKDGPVLTNPRLSSAIAFLEDIHLLSANGPTPAGLRLLQA